MKLERFLKLILFLSCVTAFMTWMQIPHGDTLGEKFGLDTKSNDILEWTDGYVAPHLTCEMEPTGTTIAQSTEFHNYHIPRLCHLEIATKLRETARNFEQMEHALLHQIMSGRGVRYNFVFPIHRHEWEPHIKADKARESLEKITAETDRLNPIVYEQYQYYELSDTRASYDFIHGEPWISDIMIPLGFLFFVFYISLRIMLGFRVWP